MGEMAARPRVRADWRGLVSVVGAHGGVRMVGRGSEGGGHWCGIRRCVGVCVGAFFAFLGG